MSAHGPRQGFWITRGENTSELCMLKIASTFSKLRYLLAEIPTCVVVHTQMIRVNLARVAEQGGGGETYPHTRTRHAWKCMLNYSIGEPPRTVYSKTINFRASLTFATSASDGDPGSNHAHACVPGSRTVRLPVAYSTIECTANLYFALWYFVCTVVHVPAVLHGWTWRLWQAVRKRTL